MEWFQTSLFQTAVTEWCGCIVYIMLSKRKQRGIRLMGICLLMLIVQGLLVYATSVQPQNASFLDWLFFRILLYLAGLWVFLRLCCEGSPVEISYLCLRSFLLAEFAWSLMWEELVYRLVRLPDVSEELLFLLQWGINIALYAVVFTGMYFLERHFLARLKQFSITRHELYMVLAITVVTFLLTSFFASHDTTVLGGRIVLSHSLVDFLGIVFVFEYRLWFANLQATHELEIIHRVVEQQSLQYDSSRGSMDVVNQKYQDIRQMLSVMRREAGQGEELQWMDAIEREIHEYNVWRETGNEVLDIVLSEKYLRCEHSKIELSCVIDGAKLKGMDAMDICAIFGNALDNAIEHVNGIPERQKRLIHVRVFEKQGFLNISVENICEQEVVMENGIPVTTKEEKEYHGYGIKSIQYVADKYHGVMAIQNKDNWFRLELIFPLPLTAKSKNG